MLLDAEETEIAHDLRTLGRIVPLLSGDHGKLPGMLSIDVDVNRHGSWSGLVRRTRVVVAGVQAHSFIIARHPVVSFLLAERRWGQRTNEQQCANSCCFHKVVTLALFQTRRPAVTTCRGAKTPWYVPSWSTKPRGVPSLFSFSRHCAASSNY